MQRTPHTAAPAASGPYRSGSVIAGKYSLVKRIGVGAMGTVWSAVNLSTKGQVALKLIEKPEPELRQRLLREACACAAIQHKNVVQVYDVAQTELGDPFLVMELLRGDTLAALLQHRRCLPPAEVAVIARDIARGLAAAHEQGTVHRDLKPANVFLHKQPGEQTAVIKLLDFGVSKSLTVSDGLNTIAGSTVGSPMYMSPEQVRGDADIDFRADLWSLGVVLYEMLTGERPFSGELTEVWFKITHAAIPRVSSRLRRVDPALDDLVAACLTRERTRRAASAAEIAIQLDAHTTSAIPAARDPQASQIDTAAIDPCATSLEPIITSRVQRPPTPVQTSPQSEAIPPVAPATPGSTAAAIASGAEAAAPVPGGRRPLAVGAQSASEGAEDAETLVMEAGHMALEWRMHPTVQPGVVAKATPAGRDRPIAATPRPIAATPRPIAAMTEADHARRGRSFGPLWVVSIAAIAIAAATFLTFWLRSVSADGPVLPPSPSIDVQVPMAPSGELPPPSPPRPPPTEGDPAPPPPVVPTTPGTGPTTPGTGPTTKPRVTSQGTNKPPLMRPKKKCQSKFGLGCQP